MRNDLRGWVGVPKFFPAQLLPGKVVKWSLVLHPPVHPPPPPDLAAPPLSCSLSRFPHPKGHQSLFSYVNPPGAVCDHSFGSNLKKQNKQKTFKELFFKEMKLQLLSGYERKYLGSAEPLMSSSNNRDWPTEELLNKKH